MRDFDLEKLAELMTNANRTAVATHNTFGDNLIKVLVALCTAAVLWTASTVSTSSTRISTMQVEWATWRTSLDADIQRLKDKADAPTYTAEMAKSALDPIVQLVNKQQAAIEETNRWGISTEHRLSALEQKHDDVLTQLKQLNTSLSPDKK